MKMCGANTKRGAQVSPGAQVEKDKYAQEKEQRCTRKDGCQAYELGVMIDLSYREEDASPQVIPLVMCK
jgi:hypothetical protein